jgi:hypothetical protein
MGHSDIRTYLPCQNRLLCENTINHLFFNIFIAQMFVFFKILLVQLLAITIDLQLSEAFMI